MMKKSQMIDGIWLVKVKFDDEKENIIFRFSTLDFHIDVKNNNPADGLSSGEHELARVSDHHDDWMVYWQHSWNMHGLNINVHKDANMQYCSGSSFHSNDD